MSSAGIVSPAVEQIARAVLYEGYLLYPYRESALKNRQRWNFGVLYPPAWSARQTGSDRSWLHMEILAIAGVDCRVSISLRFLHLALLENAPGASLESAGGAWQDAEERRVEVEEIPLRDLAGARRAREFSLREFSFPGVNAEKRGARRRRMPVEGRIELAASPVKGDVFRLAIRVTNTTRGEVETRDDALLISLASAHVAASIRHGELVSQTDPPAALAGAAAECQNTGVWPVLVGEPGDRSVVLGSPIILYDYPQIAPESKGDLFDGTEIDEILTLRILTLTDEEKQELRKCDERARRMLERIESAPGEDLLDLHGRSAFLPRTTDAQVAPRALHLIRGMREICAAPPAAAMVNGTELKKGDRVRLRPGKRADLFDTLLAGKIAVIEAVEQDFEGRVQFAVVLEEDPGRDLGEMRQAGHRFFYSVDEVEPVLNEAEP